MHSRLAVLKSALAEAPVAPHGQNRQRRRAVSVEANVLLAVLGVFIPLRDVSVTARRTGRLGAPSFPGVELNKLTCVDFILLVDSYYCASPAPAPIIMRATSVFLLLDTVAASILSTTWQACRATDLPPFSGPQSSTPGWRGPASACIPAIVPGTALHALLANGSFTLPSGVASE